MLGRKCCRGIGAIECPGKKRVEDRLRSGANGFSADGGIVHDSPNRMFEEPSTSARRSRARLVRSDSEIRRFDLRSGSCDRESHGSCRPNRRRRSSVLAWSPPSGPRRRWRGGFACSARSRRFPNRRRRWWNRWSAASVPPGPVEPVYQPLNATRPADRLGPIGADGDGRGVLFHLARLACTAERAGVDAGTTRRVAHVDVPARRSGNRAGRGHGNHVAGCGHDGSFGWRPAFRRSRSRRCVRT